MVRSGNGYRTRPSLSSELVRTVEREMVYVEGVQRGQPPWCLGQGCETERSGSVGRDKYSDTEGSRGPL